MPKKDKLSDKMTIKFKVLIVGSSEENEEIMLIDEQEVMKGEKYETDLGLDFKLEYKLLGDKEINLVLWLMKGEKYKEIKQQFYEGADGIVILFDISPENGITKIISRIDELREKAPHSSILLIGKNINSRINQIIEGYTIHLIKQGKFGDKSKLNIDFFDPTDQSTIVSQELLDFLAKKLLSRTKY